MQRYYTGSCTSAVNRDVARVDSSSLPTNFSANPRRTSHLTPYKLKCDKEPLNARLGPPDFHPQTPNCPEETLTREYVQSGYRETFDGLEEAKEIVATAPNFTKADVLNCKEAIKKRLRAINESRVQKRKAGQVYGVPLSGSQLTKPGVFPEQKPCGEDFRKKWLEGLSQQHKRLRSLADHVPHGYRKKFLIEVLVRNNVPLLRATWFIKVTYLNQIRPVSLNLSSGAADKTQLSRSELWTKDIIDYLQSLLDELFSKSGSISTTHNRDRSPQISYSGSLQHRTDPASVLSDGEEPSLHFKWWYMVRLLQWHHAEGLLIPSLIIDWVLNQLQEKELLEILQLLLPIIYGFLETLIMSQTYVRCLVGIVLRVIRDPAPGGSDLVDNSRRAYSTSALVEMLRYLILAVPDTFVSLDCFPLPSCVASHALNDGNFMTKAFEGTGKVKNSSEDVLCMFRSKRVDSHYQSVAFNHVVSSIQRRAEDLARAASHGYPGHSLAKAAQALDESLLLGDVRKAYKFLFEDISDGPIYEGWVLKVSPCLRSLLKCLTGVDMSLTHSVFFICEWATCEFRDFRTSHPRGLKLTGRKDVSEVFVAIRLLKMKMRDLQAPTRQKNRSINGTSNVLNPGQHSARVLVGNNCKVKCKSKILEGGIGHLDVSDSTCLLHDIIVYWIDQHAVHNNEGLKRVHLLIVELIRAGIFLPLLYVRQLIVSGMIDLSGNVDQDRCKRHYRILKQLPSFYLRYALDEAGSAGGLQLEEALHVYSNERRLVLNSFQSDLPNRSGDLNTPAVKQKRSSISGKDAVSAVSGDLGKTSLLSTITISGKNVKNDVDIEEIKAAISILLQIPYSPPMSPSAVVDESQGSLKRCIGSLYNKVEPLEATPGCEECRKSKRQKLSEERNSYVQGHSPILSDDGDTWWVKKGLKSSDTVKADQLKPMKQATKNRQKVVRKTQSLAQLADARIEGSQGASTSHICDNKVSCPHHRTEGDMQKSLDTTLPNSSMDIVSIGKTLKQLRCLEKRAITVWLTSIVRQQIEETEKTVGKVGQFGRPSTILVDDRTVRWKLGEDELSTILYLMDVSNDLISAVKFLLWVLPKVPCSHSSTIHSGRNIVMLPRNTEGQLCEVGEAFILSSLRRYENILAVTDIIPEVLSALMQRIAAIVASNGRVSGSASLIFARYLLKKYGNITSVAAWEKSFKSTNDKRLSSELEFGRSGDGELGYITSVASVLEDPDDFFRQKISNGRLPRVGYGMRDIVQKNVDDALHYLFGKDRKLFAGNMPKGSPVEKWDNGYQIAQQMVTSLIDCIKQTGGAAQEGDPTLVSSAVSAIVSNVGPTLAKLPDFSMSTTQSTNVSTTGSPNFAKCMLRMYITCLCLLKEALGERQSRVFEVALATEASNGLSVAFTPGKASRGHYQMSPEAHDTNTSISNDPLNTSAKVGSRATKVAAAVSALVVGVVIYGVISLERMVTVLRLKEGLDIMQFIRNMRSNSNGNVRSVVGFKADGLIEVYVHWFRLLVGNCRTISEGLIVDLLGEPSVVALSRMQRMLPLSLVFPPAYSIFALVIWWPLILNTNYGVREDVNQVNQSLTISINDALRHLPFRDVCLRDSQGLYDFMAADPSDAEFANLLELNGSDVRFKSMAFVPLRGRLFLNALIDCRMPQSMFKQEDGNRTSALGESRFHYAENDLKLQDKLVYVLDTLQPAKFHWQWVELRLLLNEQALNEKLEMHDMSLANAIQSSSPSPEKVSAASENENNFIQIILTRLLVRPDAAPLFSELVHLFGKSLEDSMLLQAKWFLGGHDVLFGRKTIRQRLINIAESKGLPIKAQFWEPWGWCGSAIDLLPSRGDKRKSDATSLEEGEVVEEGIDFKRYGKGVNHQSDSECSSPGQQHVTERAFLELVLPCIDQSSDESRNTFASDLIKQLNNIEQHMAAVTRGAGKPGGNASPGTEGQTSKLNNRKSMRGGSAGLARRSTGATDSMPPSPAALRASMALRLQLLIRFLPILCADGEPSMRNMRSTLASVILRLIGNRVVYEDANVMVNSSQCFQSKREMESPLEGAPGVFADSTESLFDRLLLVLHALLSSSRPSWLRSKLSSKMTNESNKDSPSFDRELMENLQNDLDRMQLPDGIRWRIQTAIPVLLPTVRCSLSCQPPSVSASALASLQPSISVPGFSSNSVNPSQKNMLPLTRTTANVSGKLKQQDSDMEVDPWTLLEDGTGSGPSTSNASVVATGDHAVLRASSWLKGTVRVRRTDLTYIGAVDDDN